MGSSLNGDDSMTAEGYVPVYLTLEGLARIRAVLPVDADFSPPVCDMAAFIYLDGQATEDNGTGRGLKADLRAMHREVLNCLNALAKPRIEIIALLGICGDDRTVRRFTDLRRELVWIEETLAGIVKLHKRAIPRHTRASRMLALAT